MEFDREVNEKLGLKGTTDFRTVEDEELRDQLMESC